MFDLSPLHIAVKEILRDRQCDAADMRQVIGSMVVTARILSAVFGKHLCNETR